VYSADFDKNRKTRAFPMKPAGCAVCPSSRPPAPSLASDAGLSDNKPLHVHVLVQGKEKTATRLKLMQFKNAPGKKVDNAYLHSSYGISYLSVFVTDITSTLERAARHGVRPVAKGPVAIGGKRFLAIVRDPDGNLIELIGPKAD